MRVTVPVNLTIVSSNVPETEYATWAVGTGYVAGDRVIYSHVIYEAAASTTGHQPDLYPAKWVVYSATNQYKMFDAVTSSQTSQINTIEVTVGASVADQLVLLGLSGETVDLTMRDGATVVGTETIDLRNDDESISWTEYFFNPITYRTQVIWGIPGLYRNYEVDIVITAATGEAAECGHLIIGKSKFLGLSQYGVEVGITDYSRKDVNDFGESYLQQRSYADTIDVDLWVDIESDATIQRLKSTLADIRAVPCLWDVNNADTDIAVSVAGDQEQYRTYGYYRDFSVTVKYPQVAMCSLEIEGLI